MNAARPQPTSETLAEIEGMILRLGQMCRAEPSKERRADYQAAIDRLHALAYGLMEAARPSRTS